MKQNKLLSGLLSAAMVLTLTVMPALAATAYTDVPADNWATTYINDMTAKGIFQGVEAGKFLPGQAITTDQVLAVCARIAVEKTLRQEIGTDRTADVKAIMGEEQPWFLNEYATCLEMGIISKAELKELYQSGKLTKAITREDFAFYLVRALQLGPKAERLSSYSLSFTDKASITPGREPHVYILNMYNIVTGNERNAFEPQKTATRAEACAMFSRAMDFMVKNGVSVELPEYTEYGSWQSGVIASVKVTEKGTVLLTLNNPLTGAMTVTLPAETPVYEDGMLMKTEQLKEGSYARVNLDSMGSTISVRQTGAVETVSGSVVGISEEVFLISVNGVSRTVPYDRFIDVKVGGTTGGRDLIDLKAGYSGAACTIDRQGKLVAVSLTGGTRAEEGLISAVETVAAGGYNLTITGFDGETRRLSLPPEATITVNGVLAAELSGAYRGVYVSLRVYNDGGKVATAALDRSAQYFQGALKGTGSLEGKSTITVSDLMSGRAPTYSVDDSTVYYYNGFPTSYGALQTDSFITLKLSDMKITTLWSYPASSEVSGVIGSISYPKGTTDMVVEIIKADETTATFTLDLMSPPTIMRNGRTTSVDKLVTGDVVTVTVRYSKITMVQATAQTANVTGTIAKLGQEAGSITLEVRLDDGSGTKSYTITGGVSVTQGDKTLSMYDLRPDYHVAMVTNGEQVTSLVVDKITNDANKLVGTVIFNNYKERTITLRVEQSGGTEIVYTVNTADVTSSLDATSGNPISIDKFVTGDVLDIYGTPGEGRTFIAKTIIRG